MSVPSKGLQAGPSQVGRQASCIARMSQLTLRGLPSWTQQRGKPKYTALQTSRNVTPRGGRPGDGSNREERKPCQAPLGRAGSNNKGHWNCTRGCSEPQSGCSWSSAATDKLQHCHSVLTFVLVVIKSLESIALASPRIQRPCVHHVVPAELHKHGHEPPETCLVREAKTLAF